MSIQSTVNQAFSLAALATSGSRSRRKEIETAQKNIAITEKTSKHFQELLERYDERTDNDEKTLNEWGKELKGRSSLIERYEEAFQQEVQAKRRLFEMQPTVQNYNSMNASKDTYKEQMEIQKGALEVSKLIPQMKQANENRAAFREMESERLRSSILSATEYNPQTYDPKINYKTKKEAD